MISVLEENGKLAGIISMDDIRPLLFRPDAQNLLTIAHLAKPPVVVISEFDDVMRIVKKVRQRVRRLEFTSRQSGWGICLVYFRKSGVLKPSIVWLLRSHSG